ncbi:hypothetical protein [Colwellia hornerae]|uniref:Tetratricopeptide repeat protein n=1 Tax=Colwellia hornerae TaxID=89402 RepID=A0A5C6QJY7_9GAMM|nr:hypothetical protein [Colwellia hornerae]TWX53397.1 hypothetical protein ESZ28_10130 [Colwellia hornerae]TWX60217.1 hypothetical protein ESZ26_08905 [Colwellia hornerae]TWX68990.1 hypothetical protein ESZ27_06525 [Colwellia hornerae]
MKNAQWQMLLKQGNDCFFNRQWQQAEFFYSEAYDLLAYGYKSNPLCSETMMAWICSCHNLSSLYEEIGKLTLSLRFLSVPHEYLKSVSQSEHASNDIKLLAFKGLSLTLPPLLVFRKNNPICDECVKEYGALNVPTDNLMLKLH